MFYRLVIAGSFIICFSSLVFSQPDFGKMDANGDGKVVKVEYMDGMKRTTFEKFDKNSDKEITWDEWTQMDNSPDAQKNFQSIDLDNDQKVTYSEFSNSMDRHSNLEDSFSSIDADGNGAIGPGEYESPAGIDLFKMKF